MCPLSIQTSLSVDLPPLVSICMSLSFCLLCSVYLSSSFISHCVFSTHVEIASKAEQQLEQRRSREAKEQVIHAVQNLDQSMALDATEELPMYV